MSLNVSKTEKLILDFTKKGLLPLLHIIDSPGGESQPPEVDFNKNLSWSLKHYTTRKKLNREDKLFS